MDRAGVDAWLAEYERAWRTPGLEPLDDLFTDDTRYLPSPWSAALVGRGALGTWWEAERDGPDEIFTMISDVVAVDGDTAVVRVSVHYGEPVTSRWKDLWILGFAADGRCASFEEWPFAPEQADGHDDGP